MPSKLKTIIELQEMLQSIWDSLPQELIDKAVKEFEKQLKTCVAAGVDTFKIFRDSVIVNMNL